MGTLEKLDSRALVNMVNAFAKAVDRQGALKFAEIYGLPVTEQKLLEWTRVASEVRSTLIELSRCLGEEGCVADVLHVVEVINERNAQHVVAPRLEVEEGRFVRRYVATGNHTTPDYIWAAMEELFLLAHQKPDRFRVCLECHTPFFAWDGRQKFCPADHNGSPLSRCAGRYQQRARRSRGRGS